MTNPVQPFDEKQAAAGGVLGGAAVDVHATGGAPDSLRGQRSGRSLSKSRICDTAQPCHKSMPCHTNRHALSYNRAYPVTHSLSSRVKQLINWWMSTAVPVLAAGPMRVLRRFTAFGTDVAQACQAGSVPAIQPRPSYTSVPCDKITQAWHTNMWPRLQGHERKACPLTQPRRP